MTHLRIELNGITEEVSSSVISKLYEIAHIGLDSSSNLQGRLHSAVGIRSQIQWLTSTYPSLYINVDDYAIEFEDPNIVTYLNSIGVGNNGMITEALAAAATSIYSSTANTTVTKFNEFRYFTNITTPSSGGWSGQGTNYYSFKDWTALEEIDISNLTAIGHGHTYALVPVFWGCTALKTVTASSSLEKIGTCAFRNCSNLETISGLSGEIALALRSFENCSKLTSNNFTNVLFLLGTSDNEGDDFSGCTLITSINVSSNTRKIPLSCFINCTNLSKITGLSGVTTLIANAFKNCSSLTTLTGLSNVTSVGSECFSGCTSLTAVDIDWQTVSDHTIPNSCFKNCTSLLSIDLTGVVRIKQNAFLGCTALTAITLPNTLTAIEDTVFHDSGLEELIIPSSVTSLGMFNSVNSLKVVRCLMLRLDYLQFQSNKKYFGLTSTSLTTLELPEGVFEAVEIGSALPNNELGLTMNLPASVEIFSCGYSHGNTLTFAQGSNLQYMCSIGYYTTANSFDWTQSLTSAIKNVIDGLRICCFKNIVNFPKNNLKFLPGFFFSGNSEFTGVLSDIIGDNLIAIGKNAFNGMGSLSYQIVLPSTLKYIGYGAFNRTNPTSYKILATTPPEIDNVVFDSNYNNASGCDIYVPAASVQAYKTATNWDRYASRIVAIPE